jgi:HEAT repeat protein
MRENGRARGPRRAAAVALLALAALAVACSSACRRPQPPEAILARELASDDADVAAAARERYAALDLAGREAVVARLGRELGKYPFGLANAVGALQQIAPDAVPILIAWRDVPEKREQADLVLQMMGPSAIAALPSLERSLDDPDPRARASAAAAIVWVAPERAAWIIDRTATSEPALAIGVGSQLRLNMHADRAVPGLAGLLEDDRPRVREFAVSALAELGGRAAPASGALAVRAASDSDERVREKAGRALRAIGAPAATPAGRG